MAYSTPDRRMNLFLLADGVVEVYGRPCGYMDTWIEHVPVLNENPPVGVLRISNKLYNEISPILGLPEWDSVCGPMYWMQIQSLFADLMGKHYYGHPNWARMAEQELQVH